MLDLMFFLAQAPPWVGLCSCKASSIQTMALPSLTPAAQSAVCTLQGLGRASGMLSNTDGNRVAAVCEATKEMLLIRAKKMVQEAAGMPILSSKSCDGTPLKTQHFASRALPGGKKQKTRGKRGVEVLVSNEFIRYQDPAEGWRTCCILSEPVPLTKGKTVDLVSAAARQTWHGLRALGATGCTVEHYVWDRAGIEALERHARAWHAAQPAFESELHHAGEEEFMEMIVVTPCALHDSQNAFRWAFLPQCKDRNLMRDLYIATASLRNSADLFTSRINSWVAKSLKFVESRGAAWEAEARELWLALDVDPEIVDILVSQLQVHWDGEHICVLAGAKVISVMI